jgi:hypothetical protein
MSPQLIFVLGVLVSLMVGGGLLLTVYEFRRSESLNRPRDPRFPL